jgi:hypothetical protein
MVKIPLASKSDPAKREVVTSEELVNLHAVLSKGGRSDFYLARTPGMRAWSRCSSELCRGLFNADSEGLGVYGSRLLAFNSSGGAVSRGTISGTGDVRWSQNNAASRETAIVTGSTAYQYVEAGSLTTISDGDLPSNPIDTICFNGYTLMFFADGRVFYSAINDANSYGAADFFTVPGIGDLKAAMLIGNQFIVWRDGSFYIYRHVPDDADDPFQLVQGADKAFGCINTFANADINGIRCFVDQYGAVRAIGGGYMPERISNDGVETDIAALSDKSTIRMFGYASGGRGFLIVRSDDFCWCYDLKEQRWHNRRSYQRVTWQAKHYMRFANKDLVAPDQAGDLFYLDDTLFTEDGELILAESDTPPITNFPNGGFINALHLDIETGTALGASAAAADQNPYITMFISTDGGKTFSTGRQQSLGTRGQWKKRVSWYRCGMFGREGFIIRFRLSAAIPVAFMNLDGEIEQRAA